MADHRTVDKLGLDKDFYAGRVVVITGAGRGIGLEAARAFAHLGAAVVIAEIAEAGREAEAAIRAENGRALFVQTDVSDPAQVERLAVTTREAFGPAGILINNAILCPVVRVSEMDLETWEQVMRVNLRGTFLTCKAFLPEMVRRGSGVIINMISTDAMPGLAAYIASKQGITGFSQSLALEVGEGGVRVIPFAPGMVDTPAIRGIAPQLAPMLGMSEEQFLHIPLHAAYAGLMPPEDAAAATVYLAAKLADELHGQAANGYEVLERAGIIQKTGLSAEGVARTQNDKADAEAVSEALRLTEELAVMIDETEAEFSKLPVFVRPMAKNGFKNKSGQSTQGWKVTIDRLQGRLGAVQAGQPEALPTLREEAAGVQGMLEKLVAYYRGVPAETERFTRDAAFLQQVSERMEQRAGVIQSLINRLKRISP